ncbi:MAG TPA: hypothetical protein VD998_03225 [Verrucomicrobiae bacterium]|nr:hypothetical protein [Verrucomicrobiae bacterium]
MRHFLWFLMLLVPISLFGQGGSGNGVPGRAGPGIGFEGYARNRQFASEIGDFFNVIAILVMVIMVVYGISQVIGRIHDFFKDRAKRKKALTKT